MVQFDTSLAVASTDLAKQWAGHAATKADSAQWKPVQTVLFLDTLQELQSEQFKQAQATGGDAGLAAAKAESRQLLEEMDAAYHLTAVRNAEIRFCWHMLCVRAELDRIYPLMLAFAAEQGRMKFTRPLYRELSKVPGGKALATAAFAQAKSSYHSICAKMVAKDLGVE